MRWIFLPKEYELLFYMVRNRGIALTRDRLISEVWGYDFFGDDRTLDTHIKLLRKQLGSYARYITTLRGVGYRFERNEATGAAARTSAGTAAAFEKRLSSAADFCLFFAVYGIAAGAFVADADCVFG